MQLFAHIVQGLYFCVGLTSLAAVTAIFYRLGFAMLAVLAPVVITVGVAVAFQAMGSASTGLPFFSFGLYASVMPALAVVPPICIVIVALSKRIPARR